MHNRDRSGAVNNGSLRSVNRAKSTSAAVRVGRVRSSLTSILSTGSINKRTLCSTRRLAINWNRATNSVFALNSGVAKNEVVQSERSSNLVDMLVVRIGTAEGDCSDDRCQLIRGVESGGHRGGFNRSCGD